MPWKMELLSPKSVMFFTCSIDTLDCQWRNVASAGFSSDQAIDTFWMGIETFKDAGRNACFKDLALGAIRLPFLPISNAHVERTFSQWQVRFPTYPLPCANKVHLVSNIMITIPLIEALLIYWHKLYTVVWDLIFLPMFFTLIIKCWM